MSLTGVKSSIAAVNRTLETYLEKTEKIGRDSDISEALRSERQMENFLSARETVLNQLNGFKEAYSKGFANLEEQIAKESGEVVTDKTLFYAIKNDLRHQMKRFSETEIFDKFQQTTDPVEKMAVAEIGVELLRDMESIRLPGFENMVDSLKDSRLKGFTKQDRAFYREMKKLYVFSDRFIRAVEVSRIALPGAEIRVWLGLQDADGNYDSRRISQILSFAGSMK